MSEFELKLQQLFPEIYALHLLGKDDPHVWDLVEQLIYMSQSNSTGSVLINYSEGHMNSISVKKDILAFKKRAAIDKDKLS